MKNLKAAFIGHREIEKSECLMKNLFSLLESLILERGVTVFLFGSRSEFNTMCYEAVSKLKEKYAYISRIYVRGEYLNIGEDYKKYLLSKYEHTYFPEQAINAGKLVYIIRNRVMIDESDICIFYFDKERNVGTRYAYEYAVNHRKKIFNLFDSLVL